MTPAGPNAALAAVLVDELARAGVSEAVLSPGSRSTPLALAFDADRRLRLHVLIDERSAGFLALGMARVSGRPVALVCTSGTAAANYHPAVIEAHQARVPLLVLTADRPPELRGVAANQTIDQVGLYGGAVRWFADVGAPDEHPGAVRYWRSVASRAAAVAAGMPPGPVHLNLAFREPLVPGGPVYPHALDGRAHGRPWSELAPGAAMPDDQVLAGLAAAIDGAPRGVLVLGEHAGPHAPLRTLAERCGWPVVAEALSGARVPGTISTAAMLLGVDAFARDRRPDLVLRVGRVHLARGLDAYLAGARREVLVDPHGTWSDPARTVSTVVRADPAALGAALQERVAARPDSGWRAGWLDAEGRAREALDTLLDGEDRPSEPRTARDLAATLPPGSLLVAASSMPVRDLDSCMAPRHGLRVVGNRGASGIDGFVSSALGAALAHPGPTAALAGDLSLLHDANGLLLADPPDLTVVTLNNDGGGIFSLLPQAGIAGFERLFATPHGRDLSRLAALHGCGHLLLERARDLGAVLAEAQRAGGVQLVEVRTDRAENADLHRRMREAVAAAVSRRTPSASPGA